MQIGNVAIILTIGLLAVGIVAVTYNNASGIIGCMPQKTGPCKPYDPGSNNATKIGSSTTTGSSGGSSGTIQR